MSFEAVESSLMVGVKGHQSLVVVRGTALVVIAANRGTGMNVVLKATRLKHWIEARAYFGVDPVSASAVYPLAEAVDVPIYR